MGFAGDQAGIEQGERGRICVCVYVPSAVRRYVLTGYVARSRCVACGGVCESSGRLLYESAVPSQRLDRAVAAVGL